MRIRLVLAAALALPSISAAQITPKPVVKPTITTAKPKLTASYKLLKIPTMAAAFAAAKAAAPKANATKAHRAAFHEGVSLLLAAEMARKAGDLAAAKVLAGYAQAVVGTPGATRLAQVKKDPNLNVRLGEAAAQMPTPKALTVGTETWLKQGWEPDFF